MCQRFLIAIALVSGAAALGQPLSPGAAGGLVQAPGQPVFSARSDLVVLHVTVKDSTGAYVPGLAGGDFIVYEDNRPQTIQFFAAQDAPVTVGLIIDSSGSMFGARDRVAAAAAAFVETSNPLDEIFALAFNERVRAALPPEAPFTGDAATMHAALSRAIAARGRTALYDAVLAGLAYVEKGSHQRKVLVVVSDGGDNASTATFDEVLRRTQASNVAIYTIAFVDSLERDANPKRLSRIADTTGGEAFRPRQIAEVADVLGHIARDIRHTYTIGYVPADRTDASRIRRVRVHAGAPGRLALSVRTRHGYSLEER